MHSSHARDTRYAKVRKLGTTSLLATLLGGLALPLAGSGCGGEENPYKPAPAWSGKAANVPAPPSLPNAPIKNGDAYTVAGAIHQLHSLMHAKEVTANPISITGFIVDSNIPRAPDCAVHKTGKKDPDNCNPEVPSFWIADTAGDMKSPKIRVVGWARNFAVIFDAMTAYKKLKPGVAPTEKEAVTDDMLNVTLPFPLPSIGAKVKLTGAYNFAKTVVSDMVSEPVGGVMSLQKYEEQSAAPSPAAFAKKIP
jgi:hypothetical protein